MEKNKYYYDVSDDLAVYPDCWALFAWSGRNTGKTYSALRYCIENRKRFIFVKRTIEDVKLILSGSGKIGTKISQFGADFSPFKALNRDLNYNIRAFGIYKGYIGGFWRCSLENEPVGDPVGYVLPLNAVAKVKGFDLSDCDLIIFDEFIPNQWDRVDKQEGKQLLDLYMTVARDREHRGREPLRLIGLANPTDINCPIFQELEIADAAADMAARGTEYREERGILLHQIMMGMDFRQAEEDMPALRAMIGTAWREAALGDGFAYNATDMIRRINLKGFRCLLEIIYRRKHWYIYQKDALFYCCSSQGQPVNGSYDLSKDTDVKRFFREWQIDLREEYTEGNFLFQTYTMYDVIINYRKFFKDL